MKKLIATVLVTTTVLASHAADTNNVAVPAPAPTPKYPWDSSASLGLTITEGNSENTLVAAGVHSDKKTPIDEYSLGLDGSYGKNNGVENNELLQGFSQWNHLFSERLFSYLRVDGMHDGISDVTYRFTIGPGAGYYFIKDKQTTLAGEIGAAEVIQRLGESDSSYTTVRFAERFEHKFDGHGARVWEKAEILPDVSKVQNYIVNAEIGLESALTKSLSFQSFIDDSYNSEPADGRKRNDVKLVSGIKYKF